MTLWRHHKILKCYIQGDSVTPLNVELTINVKKIAFGTKQHTTDKKMGASVLLRLFISTN